MTRSAPRRPLAAAALATGLSVIAVPALASGATDGHAEGTAWLGDDAMSYALFETVVPHVDLAACPAQFDPEAVFCRMTLAGERAHVFAFAYRDDQPLLAVKSYELDEGFLPF